MPDEQPISEEHQSEENVNEEELSDYEESEQKKKKMLYIIIFVIQIIVGLALVKFLIIPWYNGKDEEVLGEEFQDVQPEIEQKEIGTIYRLPALTVNPKGSRGRRFAVIEIAFSVPEEVIVEDVKKYEPVLIDNLINYFRSKTVADLSIDTVMTLLKDDVMEITSNVVGGDKIQDIYFTNFILQ